MKYLEYYEKAMKTGKLLNSGGCYEANGLCYEKGFDLDLFEPTSEDCHRYNLGAYWAAEVDSDQYYNLKNGRKRAKSEFGPTRQNIVLFLAAINEEL